MSEDNNLNSLNKAQKESIKSFYEQLQAKHTDPITMIIPDKIPTLVDVIIVEKSTGRRVYTGEMMIPDSVTSFRDRLFKWCQNTMFPEHPKVKSKKLPEVEPFLIKIYTLARLLEEEENKTTTKADAIPNVV